MSTLRRLRRGVALFAASAVAGAGLAVMSTTPAQAAEIPVTNAEFRWGINNESNNQAFFGINLFSAGKIGNPEEGGQFLNGSSQGQTWGNGKEANWKAEEGNVRIEKRQPDDSYALTTWAGVRTNVNGGSLAPVHSPPYSEHQIVISNGSGTVDPETDSATLEWEGDFTVVYYDGATFWYASDPVLDVENGDGAVTATLSGYASDMETMTLWEEIPPREVTLANLSDVEVTDEGFIVTPDYLGVEYDHEAGGGSAQATQNSNNEAYWGSFPQDFVEFQQITQQSSYWYTSGLSVDPGKVALPLEVSYTVPGITVSDTELWSEVSHTVTVEGTGFTTTGNLGTRPPLSGQPAGVYVVFGDFDDVWEYSENAPTSARRVITQKWALPEPSYSQQNPNGTNPLYVLLEEDGSFELELEVAEPESFSGNLGIYTYAGGGAVNAGEEFYTPIEFYDDFRLPETPSFNDVNSSHLFYGDIEWLVAKKITEGYPSNNTYRPANAVNRGSMAAFLYRAAGEPEFEAPATPSFNDVNSNHLFYKEIEWLVSEGITEGYPSNNTYRPGNAVNRGSMAAFLYRAADEPEFEAPATPSFNDVNSNHLFYEEIEWLVSVEVTEGYLSNNTYRPGNAVNRGSMAAFLHRMDGLDL